MNRREIIGATIAVSASNSASVPALGKVASAASKKSFLIEAPDDIYIVSISAADGAVKAGQTLMILGSFSVERIENQLALFEEHINIMERPFKDGRIDEEIQMLKNKLSFLLEINAAMATRLKEVRDKMEIGQYGAYVPIVGNSKSHSDSSSEAKTAGSHADPQAPLHTLQITSITKQTSTTDQNSSSPSFVLPPDYKNPVDLEIEYSKNQIELLDAKIAASQADRRKQDALDKINLAKNKLARHREILLQYRSALKILSAVDGVFTSLVQVGSFVKKGHVLGELLS